MNIADFKELKKGKRYSIFSSIFKSPVEYVFEFTLDPGPKLKASHARILFTPPEKNCFCIGNSSELRKEYPSPKKLLKIREFSFVKFKYLLKSKFNLTY